MNEDKILKELKRLFDSNQSRITENGVIDEKIFTQFRLNLTVSGLISIVLSDLNLNKASQYLDNYTISICNDDSSKKIEPELIFRRRSDVIKQIYKVMNAPESTYVLFENLFGYGDYEHSKIAEFNHLIVQLLNDNNAFINNNGTLVD